MRSRQLVCNDEAIVEFLGQFVPVVDNPGDYVEADISRLQCQLVERILEQSPYGQVSGAQGLYVVTPSGRLLARAPDPRTDRGEDARSRGPESIPLGVLFTLNGTNSNDQVPPEYYQRCDWALRSPR